MSTETTTLQLPCVRFVRQVTNGRARSKYSYKSMMSENEAALKGGGIRWTPADCAPNEVSMTVNAVAATDAEVDEEGNVTSPPSYRQYIRDCYDAYKQGGDGSRTAATMCGYAGMVAYRFKIPQSAINNGRSLLQMTLPISRDRYCRSGVRVAVVFGDNELPSLDWIRVRGEEANAIVSESTPADGVDGVSSWGFLGQEGCATLLESTPAMGLLTFDANDFAGWPAGTALPGYIWVYLSIEDYCDYWTLYSAKEPRYYSIEGSAMLEALSAEFEFKTPCTPDVPEYLHANSVGDVAATTNLGNQFSDAQIALYGNLLRCVNACAVFSPYNESGIFCQLERIRWKSMFDSEAQPFNQTNSIPLPVSDLGVFAGLRATFTYDSYSGKHVRDTTFANTMTVSCEVSRRWRNGDTEIYGDQGLVPGEGNEGLVYANTWAAWRFAAIVVPSGAKYYRKMRFTSGASATVSTGIECDILIWKSTSPELVGPFASAALMAIASDPKFVTGKEQVVYGTFAGDGEERVSVSAHASLVQRIPYSSISLNNTNYVNLVAPVRPGDVLIFVPSISDKTKFQSRDPESLKFSPAISVFEFAMP